MSADMSASVDTSKDIEKSARSRPMTSTTPKHPMLELLAHYASVFGKVWQHRNELVGPERMVDELAFLPAALSLQATPPHPAPRRTIWAIIAMLVIAVLWACFGMVDIVAVASGRIVVSEGTKVIQPLETSIVKGIHVKDGDKVKAGQVLIDLDPTTAHADESRVVQERRSALSELWRTEALIDSILHGKDMVALAAGYVAQATHPAEPDVPNLAQMEPQLQAEWLDVQAQQAKLSADVRTKQAELATVKQEIAKLHATLPIVRQREKDFDALVKQGFMSEHSGQDKTQARIEMERDLATAQAREKETSAAIMQAQQALSAWRTQAMKDLHERHAKAELQQGQLQADRDKTTQRERLATLTAPVNGTVQQLAVHTTGGVVTPAQVLLVVVPDQAKVTADVMLENKDIGFVKLGQAAEIKLETFPYTRYGTVPAEVTTITADAVLQDSKSGPQNNNSDTKTSQPNGNGGAVFPATLTLAKSTIDVDEKAIRLTPGMNVTAEIKTGKRRVIDYLLSPVQSYAKESLRER